MIKLSIVVPVYNVEKYIRPCIESIFKQELDEECFEVIIVNDGTKDRSMEMISDIINQHSNIIIINQGNLSLSVARNNGINIAKGEYILMPDSDDLLIENSLKPLLEKAIETKADLVAADFIPMDDEEISHIQTIPQKDFSIKEETGEQFFLEDLSPKECYVWRTLYRREFLIKEKLRFYPGIRFQDIPFTHECYLKAQKCLRISWFLNIYRKWPGASTNNIDIVKARDFCTAIALTWKLNSSDLNPAVALKLNENIWRSFSDMIFVTCHELKRDKDRIQVIDFLKKLAPSLTFQNGKKQQFASFFYRYMPHTYVRLRYFYQIIYEERIRPLYYYCLKNL